MHEGVVKFRCQFHPSSSLAGESLGRLCDWRNMLFAKGLMGQDPNRYGGAGYGNVSQRCGAGNGGTNRSGFVISGTQTGGIANIGAEHFSRVLSFDLEENRLVAQGPVEPSSESLTHGVVYEIDPAIGAVFHVHSVSIWNAWRRLGIPRTRSGLGYGSVEVAQDVVRLFQETAVANTKVFVMGGHEDGVVSFGNDVDDAGTCLLRVLESALGLK